MSAVLYEQSVVARINRKFRRMNLGSLQLRCKRGSAKYYLQHRPTEYILSHDIDLEQLARQLAVLQPDEWE